MASPPAGLLALRLEVEPGRLGEPRRAIDAARAPVRGSQVRETAAGAGGALEVEYWIEYRSLDDVAALLDTLRSLARRVEAPRIWCARCARWHESREDGRRMLTATSSPCRPQ